MTHKRMPVSILGLLSAIALAGMAVGAPPPKSDLKPSKPCAETPVKPAKVNGKLVAKRTEPKAIRRDRSIQNPIILPVANDAVLPDTVIAILEVRTKSPCG